MAAPPFLTKRTLACENSRFSVFLDELAGHGWPSVQDYLVVAPKQVTDNLVTGVAVLPIVDGKIGLLRIYRHAIQSYLWEIPRGFVDPGESDRTSALRELEEETGLACADADLESLGLVAPEPGILAGRAHLFVARRCRTIKPFSGEEFGHREFRLFELEQVLDLYALSEIQDSTTLSAYFLYRNGLAK